MSYNGMTIEEIADASMFEEHSRFDQDHIAKCSDCYEAALDFAMEQEDEARLDAMIAEEAA